MKRSCEEVSQLTISCCPYRPVARTSPLYPSPLAAWQGTLDFIAGLTRAGKDYKKTIQKCKKKKNSGRCLWDQDPSENDYLRHYKEGKDWWKHCWSAPLESEKDSEDFRLDPFCSRHRWRRLACDESSLLLLPMGRSLHTIHKFLCEDLGLEKKTARQMPGLLSTHKKQE